MDVRHGMSRLLKDGMNGWNARRDGLVSHAVDDRQQMDEADNGMALTHGQANTGEATSEVERPNGTPVQYYVISDSATTR
ncbi:unnamed protein product [Gongylonema pulchrum]|uniref:DUF1918 domain-containing protein n=1 Tax=Gongylonema pulchrum TaxID=637853 RepID=A0A183E473_9BILA|nr:unnamed protein product [Gongylonema pulchrum]